ncbi:MAG: cell division protein ZapD [Burkholderiaceae bacterium]
MILYEYPFTERIRTLLRLEDLFDRLGFFLGHSEPQCHHAALTTLFEILDVASRADLKSDLLQELERQRQTLTTFRNNPGVSEEALEHILVEIEAATRSLGNLSGKTGQHLRDHEWLTSIRSRSIIPGGTCEFDLPSYHAWLHRPAASRLRDLETWVAPLHPLRDCLRIVLRLLRDSGQQTHIVASQGSYQQMLGGKSYHMLRVVLDEDLGAIPEISANRYMIWVRFTTQDGGDMRPKPFESDVPFELVLCNL